jgi:hypothetical protein
VGGPDFERWNHAESVTGVVCQIRFSSLGRGDYSYDVELYASAKMFASA